MTLPLAKLNRDEVYTFIVGIFAALAWYLHFQEIGIIDKNASVIDASVVFAWLFSTGLIHIFYMILTSTMELICQQKIKKQNDDEELQKMDVTKYISFFWAGPLEEQKLLLHIYGLGIVSLLFVYHPVVSFISTKVNLTWVLAIHVTYTIVTIVAYLMVSKTSHYLHQVNHFLDKGYCDTLDQTTYIREMAVHFAKAKNDDYLAHLKAHRMKAAPQNGGQAV